MTDKKKSETNGQQRQIAMTPIITGLSLSMLYIFRRFWRSPERFLREIFYLFDTTFEISDFAKASHKGERLVIRDWQHARESGDFSALAHIQRYEWITPRVAELECLDAGCGSGYGTYHLAKNGVKSILGVDLSRMAITFARNRYNSENLEFGIMDGRNLAVRDESFDVVISFDVMEHLDRECQDGFVSEMARVLRPSGHAYLGCPNASKSSGIHPFHLGELTRDEFETLLRKYFRDVQSLGQDLMNEGRRQFGNISIVGRIRTLDMNNFIIVDEKSESAYGLLAICNSPFKNMHRYR